MTKFLKKIFLVIIILLLGAAVRLYRIPEYVIFLGDEGRDAIAAYNIIHGHLTLLGPTSSVGGFFLGPVYYYFMAPFLWLFNYNPVGPAIMVALFGLATILLIYHLGKSFFNEKAGLIASFLYAIAPIIITYSRSSWNPNILPFFSLSTLFILYKGIQRKNFKILFLTGMLFGIDLQLHYLATFLGVVIFLYILLTQFLDKPKPSIFIIQLIKKYIYIFFGFLLGFSPFLVFEARHEFLNTQNIIKFIFNSPDAGVNVHFFNTVSFVFTRIFGGLVFNYPNTDLLNLYSNNILNFWFWLGSLIGLASLAFLFKQLIQSRTNQEKFLQYILFVVWAVAGVLLFGFYKKDIYNYYFSFIFPLPFLLFGNLLSQMLIFKKIKNLPTVFSFLLFSTAVLLISLVVSTDIILSPLRIGPNNQVNQIKDISSFVLSKTNNKTFNFALLSNGNSDYAFRYFFKLWNRNPVVIEIPAVDPKRKTVTDQLMVICDSPCSPLDNSLWEVAGFGEAKIDGKWPISIGNLYRLVHIKKKPLLHE